MCYGEPEISATARASRRSRGYRTYLSLGAAAGLAGPADADLRQPFGLREPSQPNHITISLPSASPRASQQKEEEKDARSIVDSGLVGQSRPRRLVRVPRHLVQLPLRPRDDLLIRSSSERRHLDFGAVAVEGAGKGVRWWLGGAVRSRGRRRKGRGRIRIFREMAILDRALVTQ